MKSGWQALNLTTTLVAGATRAIGLELSHRLVLAGHIVYLGVRDLHRGGGVAETIGAHAILTDVTDEASVQAAAGGILCESGALDVLINDAGISSRQRPVADTDVEDLQTVLTLKRPTRRDLVERRLPDIESRGAYVDHPVRRGLPALASQLRNPGA